MTTTNSNISSLNTKVDYFIPVVEYKVLQGTGNNYFYIKRRPKFRIAQVIFHVYNDGFLRTESISQEENNENLYIIWTNYSLATTENVGVDIVWIKENYQFNDWDKEDYGHYKPDNDYNYD